MTGNRDPLKDFVVELFEPGHSTPTPPRPPAVGPSTASPVATTTTGRWTGIAVVVAVAAHLLPSALSAFVPTDLDPTLTRITGQAVTVLGRLQLPLILLAVVVAGYEVTRWNITRQRQRLLLQVRTTTGFTPRSVRVTRPGLRHPRKTVVRLAAGTPMPEKKIADLREAINAGARHDYSVIHDGMRDRLIVQRSTPTPDDAEVERSERHTTLADAVTGSPLGEGAAVTVRDTDTDGTETAYRITFNHHLRVAATGFQTAVGDALVVYAGDPLPGRRWALDWQPASGYVDLFMREGLPTRVEHPVIDDYPGALGTDKLVLPYATGAGGVIASWDVSLSSQAPHMLVVGPTGGGKTSLIRTVLVEGTRRDIGWLCCDPKQIELVGCEAWPGVAAVAYELNEMVAMLVALRAEMTQRFRMIRIERMNPADLSLIGVVLDEFLIMSKAIARAAKSGDEETKAWIKEADPLGIVEEILALGRSAAIRMLVGVQRPDARIFGDGASSVRDNFRTRASLSRLSQHGAMMMWDDADAGTDLDQSVAGQATVSDAGGNPTTGQVWWTPDVDVHPRKWATLTDADRTLVTALRPAASPTIEAYSPELQAYLAGRKAPSLSKTHVELDELLPGVDDAVPARDITVGTVVQVEGPDGAEVTAEVTDVRRPGKTVVLILASDKRGRTELECTPDELIFTLTPPLV